MKQIITVEELLRDEWVWNKELVMIRTEDEEGNGEYSEIKRLEFQYEALDNCYKVEWIEPMYDHENKKPYLLIHCEK
jgi:hypothetical protein